MTAKTKILIGIGILVLIFLVMFVTKLISKGGFGPPPFERRTSQSNKQGCTDPISLKTPVDLSQVTSILYPGQERGGNFKPHGGFRFDNATSTAIEVRAPLTSELKEAQRYMEHGEEQYMIDFVDPCGVVYRFDHLADLAPKFSVLTQKLPLIDEEAWIRGNDIPRQKPKGVNLSVEQGELIATNIGFKKTNNVFVDLGVYDLRGKSAFQNPRPYAVCWFDFLPTEDAAKVKSLPPGDSTSGATSTLCK